MLYAALRNSRSLEPPFYNISVLHFPFSALVFVLVVGILAFVRSRGFEPKDIRLFACSRALDLLPQITDSLAKLV